MVCLSVIAKPCKCGRPGPLGIVGTIKKKGDLNRTVYKCARFYDRIGRGVNDKY